MSAYDRAYYRRQGELAAEWEWNQRAGGSASDEEDPAPLRRTTKTVHVRTESRKARQQRELAGGAGGLCCED